jgi:hypothetical protein
LRWLTSEVEWLRSRSGAELTLAMALGTFQTCVLVFVLLALFWFLGDLGKLLGGLSTAAGIGVFLLLWLTTLYCTLHALDEVGLEKLDGDPVVGMLLSGAKWGGLDGMLFLLVPLMPALMVLSLDALFTDDLAAGVGGFYAGTFVLMIAAAFAAFIGAQIGVIAALIQVVLLYAARRVVSTEPRVGRDEEGAPRAD